MNSKLFYTLAASYIASMLIFVIVLLISSILPVINNLINTLSGGGYAKGQVFPAFYVFFWWPVTQISLLILFASKFQLKLKQNLRFYLLIGSEFSLSFWIGAVYISNLILGQSTIHTFNHFSDWIFNLLFSSIVTLSLYFPLVYLTNLKSAKDK